MGEGALLINFSHHIKSRLTLTCKEQHSANSQWWAHGTRAKTGSCCPNQPKRGGLVFINGQIPHLNMLFRATTGLCCRDNNGNVTDMFLDVSGLLQPGWTLAGHGKMKILKSRLGAIKSSLRGWGKKKQKKLMGKEDQVRKGNHWLGREKQSFT